MVTTETLTNRSQTIARLSTTIPHIFNDAQKPNAVLVRFSIALRKLQEICSLKSPTPPGQPQDIDFDGEEAFHKEYIRNVNRILPIRRKEPHADSIVRFVATFLQYTQKQDQSNNGANDNPDDMEDDLETISSRFVRALMVHILKGLTAKATPVRLRCCQIIALSVSCLGELDEDLYQDLRTALFQRIKDRETSVRIQAVTALSRLQTADDEPDTIDGLTISEKLSWILRHDASAEVRRVVLMNLEVTPQTLPYLIERARDVDPLNRRLVYTRPLTEISDFRLISSEDRYKLIKWGLSDREVKVQTAAGKMIADHWIKQAGHNLLEFLERMDVMDGMEGGVSEKMLACLLELRMSSMNIKFDDQFWDNLSPESAFLAHVYTNVLSSQKLEEKLDEILPEVTRHAFYIQHYNSLWEQASKDTEGEYEFIVAQLLGIAKRLDYADEVGRRKMYSVLRDIILVPDLPDDHLGRLVDLISLTAMDECDFTRIMIDVISDIQEQADIDDVATESSSKRVKLDDLSLKSVKPEPNEETDPKILQVMLAKLKCLSICKFMLERCEQPLQVNSTIYGLLNQLIVPAVQSKEAVLREEGLHCLGLVCHLDKDLALHNIPLFERCIRSGHDELKKKALMILFDLIMRFGYATVSEKLADIPELFEYCLDNEAAEVQYIASEGLAKLILSRLYKNEETLKLLVLLYFFPTDNVIGNSKLQQCLAYFFPAYCHSNSENQQSISKIGVPSLEQLVATYLDLEANEHMVEPITIAEMITYWTDPRLVVECRRSSEEVDMAVQGNMAIQILDVIHSLRSGDTVLRKVMCHMLTKLYLDHIDQETLKTILDLSNKIDTERPIPEASSRNQVHKVIRHLKSLPIAKEESTETNPASTRESSVSTVAATTITTTDQPSPSTTTPAANTTIDQPSSPSSESVQQPEPTLPAGKGEEGGNDSSDDLYRLDDSDDDL
ncbi:nuclear condensing complex subunit [Chlamydoabsidia padenii]|nr:nuclear condensing complex subunit [Chlamydoabsidia padenii]